MQIKLDEWTNEIEKRSALIDDLAQKLQLTKTYTHLMVEAAKAPVMRVRFDGEGPKILAEGSYHEIAAIVPFDPKYAEPGITTRTMEFSLNCGLHTDNAGNLSAVLCSTSEKMHEEKPTPFEEYKLWSSSYQATSTMGRRFDRILKGRAQFRLSTEILATIGGVTALTLLDASNQASRHCLYDKRGCEAAHSLQTAGLIIGAVAGLTWLVGKSVNPQADTRYVRHMFESGYVLW